MNSKNNIPDLSYYRLSLMDFLRESHPERLKDEPFISARTEAAAETYAQAVLNGSDDLQADNEAHLVLFENLYFSKHDMIENILWDEFPTDVPEEDAREFAIKIFPLLESVFSAYTFSDDFIYGREYELLYTELTGAIQLIIDNGELKKIYY